MKYSRSLALICACVSVSITSSLLAAEKPNVVLILGDDMGWTDYGFMGSETVKTPHLDRLAREGAVFTRGYVPYSLCRPSLMSLVTGLYPHQHGVTGNDPMPASSDRNRLLKHVRRVPTVPRLLGEQGYLSFQSGKWWEGNYREGGFTHGMTHGDTSRGGRHGDLGLAIGRETMQPLFDFIDQAGEKPFFLWYAPMLPHKPHNPPEQLLAKYSVPGRSPRVATYYAMCEWFDETCGQLLDYLDTKKLTDNTLVVYVCDNGWIQSPDSSQNAPKNKKTPYDGGLRSPIVLRWPGKIKPARVETPISSVDLAPTMLSACGATLPSNLPGINLLDVLSGKRTAPEIVFGEIGSHDIPDIDDPTSGLLYRWCLQDRWKLILPHHYAPASLGPNHVELYDVLADPREEHNLAAAKPEMVTKLTERINAWWAVK